MTKFAWVRALGFLALAFAGLTGTRASAAPDVKSGSFLILHDWHATSPGPTPTFLRTNKSFLETLPFDGIAVYVRNPDGSINATLDTMTNKPIGYPAIAQTLAPLKGLQMPNLTQNFAAVLSGRPPDFFSDWSIIIRNFADLAKAAREAGLKGVYFDNENYQDKWGHYPNDVEHPTLPLRDYQDQARVRGRQVMEAMVAQFPDIVVITLHGPYISERKSPAPLFPQWWSNNQLTGPFFCGFVEGAGKHGTVVDGGKLFNLRTPKDFLDSYTFRKGGIAADKLDCEFIPAALRRVWPTKVNVGFGVYDKPFGDADMLPDILRPTLANALRQSDRYVWLCVERITYLKPSKNGGVGEAWVDAVRQARADATQKMGKADGAQRQQQQQQARR